MKGGSEAPRQLGLGDEIFPRGKLAADLALWEFDEQDRDVLGDRLELIEGHQPVGRADWAQMESVEPLGCLILMDERMGQVVAQDDVAFGSLGMDPKRDLLGHREIDDQRLSRAVAAR